MQLRRRASGVALAPAAIIAAIALAACGAAGTGTAATGTSAPASQLLTETFTGSHKMTSGTIDVELVITPQGSSTLTTPITLSLRGPFQDRGPGKVGNADLKLRVTVLGAQLFSAGLKSLDGKGYVSIGTQTYQLPARDFRQLESSLTARASGSASATGIIGRLGIDPLRWLVAPTISGSATVAGASTTRVHARVNVSALLDDLTTVLGKASSLGVPNASKLSTAISPATRAKILAEVRSPTVDVWTGATDRTLRKLAVNLTLPVTGTLSSTFGGLKSAAVSLDVAFGRLNQPQTFAPPVSVRPFAQFRKQVHSLAGSIRGLLSSQSSASPGG